MLEREPDIHKSRPSLEGLPLSAPRFGLSGWSEPDFETIRQNVSKRPKKNKIEVPINERVIPPEFQLYSDLERGVVLLDSTVFPNGQH
ncbi:hypothetical protein HYT02_00145 [Candidatus Gottesmanbacteria bacterium]|nr:hypothetical protein [Candidatus Gottesmanbacteria bacterium]